MTKVKNVSPFGDLEVPLLGQVIAAGAVVDVPEEQARVLLLQEDNFKAWGPAAQKAHDQAVADNEKASEQGAAPIAPPAEEDDAK